MSYQAIVNPEELERFARELKRFNDEIKERTNRLQGQFRQLGETWRDQEHRKFAEEFWKTMGVIQAFTKTADKHVPFLLRKAERAREYLRQR